VADSITVSVNGRAVAFELHSLGPHHKLYENGEVNLMVTNGRCYVNVGGPPVSGTVGDTPQEARERYVDEASEWAPVLSELARLGIGGGK
jgi:hypothetical protein